MEKCAVLERLVPNDGQDATEAGRREVAEWVANVGPDRENGLFPSSY